MLHAGESPPAGRGSAKGLALRGGHPGEKEGWAHRRSGTQTAGSAASPAHEKDAEPEGCLAPPERDSPSPSRSQGRPRRDALLQARICPHPHQSSPAQSAGSPRDSPRRARRSHSHLRAARRARLVRTSGPARGSAHPLTAAWGGENKASVGAGNNPAGPVPTSLCRKGQERHRRQQG